MQSHTIENHLNFGLLMRQRGDLLAAQQAFTQATQIDPQSPVAWLALAELCLQQGLFAVAAGHCEHAIQCDPESSRAYVVLGSALSGQTKYEQAERHYRKAKTLQPDMLDAIVGEADALVKQGKLEAAFECIRTSVNEGTDHAGIAIVFADIAHITGMEEQAAARLETLLERDTISRQLHIQMHFTLGNLYDRMGLYDKAFQHYDAGNKLASHACSTQDDQRRFSSIIDAFSRKKLRSYPYAEVGRLHPVFIIGMPRSGTSLVEQILSCHSEVYAGGERPDMPEIAQNLPAVLGINAGFPYCVSALSEDVATNVAREHYSKINALAGNKRIFTDKLPHNFLLLGLVSILFPNARVIHCTRNPLDTCLSIYFQFFAQTNAFDANNLTTIGHHYRRYQALMRHWKKVLDIPILDISYEDLVAQQENVSRKVLEFCGLPWEESCLDFYKSRRLTRTASHEQVRQPIYTRSVNRWENYSKHLEPLKTALSAPEPVPGT